MPRNIVKIRPKKNLFESVGVKNIELKEIIIYEKLKKIETIKIAETKPMPPPLGTGFLCVLRSFGTSIIPNFTALRIKK